MFGMSYEELLDRPIAFQRAFARLGVGVTGALMLSQAVYWSTRSSDGSGWFYKTMGDWEEETSLSAKEQATARGKLKALGVLEEVKRGVPCQLHYRVNFEILAQRLNEHMGKTRIAETAKLDLPKGQNLPCPNGKTIYSTEITTETTAENTPYSPPQGDTPSGQKTKKPKSEAITFKAWIDQCKTAGVDAIPEGDPVFVHAEKSGLPLEFVALEWEWFREKYGHDQARQRDWRQKFRNAVNGAWGKLWWYDAGASEYKLTSAGYMLKNRVQAEAA